MAGKKHFLQSLVSYPNRYGASSHCFDGWLTQRNRLLTRHVLGHSDNQNELREMGVALNSVRASAEDIDPFFETFPEGGPWRLVWINGPHSNATDPFDPLIDCLFVGVGLNSVSKKALAGAGWLPLLIIGSIWHDGRKMALLQTFAVGAR